MTLHCFKLLAPICISLILIGFIKCESSQSSEEKLSDGKADRTAPSPIDAPKSGRQAKDMEKRELAGNRDAPQVASQRKINKPRGNHGNRRQPPTGVPNQQLGKPSRIPQGRRNPPIPDRNRRPDQNGCRGKYIHRIIVRNKFPCPNPHLNANPPVNRHPYYYN